MLALFAFAAALGAIPQAIDAQVGEGDYPVTAYRRGEIGLSGVEAVIGTGGTALRCDVVASTRNKALDDRACALVMRRFRFVPARDEAGAATAGVVRMNIQWAIIGGSSYRYATESDMTLTVSGLPPCTTRPTTTTRIVLTPAGRLETCEIAVLSGSSQLDRLACPAVAAATLLPVRGANGEAIRAIRELRVSFAVGR